MSSGFRNENHGSKEGQGGAKELMRCMLYGADLRRAQQNTRGDYEPLCDMLKISEEATTEEPSRRGGLALVMAVVVFLISDGKGAFDGDGFQSRIKQYTFRGLATVLVSIRDLCSPRHAITSSKLIPPTFKIYTPT